MRLLLTLALFVAALPLRASDAVCAPHGSPVCAMACCAKRTMRACMDAPAKPDCGCEMKAASLPPARVPKALVPSFEAQFLHAIPLASPMTLPRLAQGEPGFFGLDSGPPPDPPHRDDASRAPPSVRA